jgi:hypothetical protein
MNGARPSLLVWDTSALIAAWVERYPPDILPPLWDKVAGAIRQGEMIAPEEVERELKSRSTDLREFLLRQNGFFVPTDAAVLTEVSAILSIHQKLVMARKRASAADPFVIATARLRGGAVVTEEGRGSPAKPKITDVCEAYGIRCVGLLDAIRLMGWRF